ncbi:RNA polymerase sigma factor [Rhizobium tumorigenes]|uniref:RNA polymerase sigma factor n=1 Tax=Rhizobium tumorigenes TaxID=2041385 RepID=A0AAF1K7Q8_9HYPH|nr:RNA polymerase sigma factor [Rhizobium tumorigenes]WFR94221.1 RNA polymerase sigma factor [Rhizobium tumorigenes]
MRAPIPAPDIRRDLVGLLPKLRRFAVTLTGDVADADELLQKVCQRSVAKIHLWNTEERLDSWLYAMTRQVWVEESRRHRVRAGTPRAVAGQKGDAAVLQPRPTEGSDSHQAIAALPDGLASVFLLADVEGHSYKQTADILGIPLSIVASRLANARLAFAAAGRNRLSQRS